MSVCKMCSVSIAGGVSQIDTALSRLVCTGVFQPDELGKFYSDTSSFVPMKGENPYTAMESALYAIMRNDVPSGQDDPLISDEDINGYIAKCTAEREIADKEIVRLKALIEENEKSRQIISHFKDLDVDLEKIFSCEYTVARFGVMAVSGYEKFKNHYSDKEIIFFPAAISSELCYGVYFAPKILAEEANRIFSSLYFQELSITEHSGTPKKVYETLGNTVQSLKDELKRLENERADALVEEEERFSRMLACVIARKERYEIHKYVGIYRDRFIICGWCPEADGETFRTLFDDVDGMECTVEAVGKDTKLSPPVKLKNNILARPYEFYVQMYGLPSYNEPDPTPFVAFTYTLLFGVMFGDLGQGLVLAIIGALMWHLKKMPLGKILIPCGISSAVFGVIYGSVFGFEELLDPMFRSIGFSEKPVDVMKPETTQMLIYGAVGAGVVLVLASILMNIFSCIKQKKALHAVFSANGLCGIVFYVSVLSLLLFKNASAIAIPAIIVSLVLIFFSEPLIRIFERKKPLEEGQTVADFAMQTFFELFETALSYVTNTMSFLRVGAFILVHAGMMKVVFTLAEMSSGVPYVLILIFGNALVMCLEALLVGIQVLRLEFYEMFSRFFKGEGEPYMPVAAKEK